MKVFGWSAGDDGCRYYRMQLPLQQLRKTYGWNTYFNEQWRDSYDFVPDAGWREPDVVVGQRVSNSATSQLWQKICKRENRPFMVYELDDDFFNIAPDNPAYKFFSEHQGDVIDNIACADRVTVSTTELAGVVSKYNSKVVVIPNYIPQAVVDMPLNRHASPITIGWGGSYTHNQDWPEVDKQLRRFFRQTGGVELHLMGNNYAEDWKSVPVRFTQWIKNTPGYHAALDFDIGLAPLRASTFNRSKSHIKTLEYAARGIPAVASDVGPYSGFVRHGETGFLVKNEWEWYKYLRELVEVTDLRVVMGDRARDQARGLVIEKEANIYRWKKALTPS